MKVKLVISEPIEVIDPFLTELATQMLQIKKALVITGAGISCSSGIPVNSYLYSYFTIVVNSDSRISDLQMDYTI